MSRLLLKLLLAALAIRWTYSAIMFAFYGSGGLLGVDSGDYVHRGLLMANGFADGTLHGWQWLGPDPITMPLFTWLLGISGFAGNAYAAFTYVLIEGVFDSATCLAIFGMARTVDERYAVPAAIAAVINPTQIVMSGLVYPDTPFVFFVSIFLLGALRWWHQPSWPSALVMAGGLIAAAWMRALVTPFSIALVAFLFVSIVAARRFERRHLLQLSAVFAIFVLGVAPISLRNHVVYGSWSLTSQGGLHLLRWIVPLVWEARDGTPWAQGYAEMERRVNARPRPDNETEFQMSERYTAVAMEELQRVGIGPIAKAWAYGAAINLATPGIVLSPPVMRLPRTGFYATTGTSVFEKIQNFLFRSDNALYSWILLAGIASVVLIRLLQLIGAGAMLAQGHVVAIMLLTGWCVFILLVNGPVASPKYRLPMEPALAVMTGAGWALLRRRTRAMGP